MGANDPIRTTTAPGSTALVAAVTGAIRLTLADRSGGGLLANPVLASAFEGKETFMRALASKAVYLGWGADKFSAVAEGTDFTVLSLGSSSSTLTPTRRGFARQVSDMLRSLDSWGLANWAQFAADTTIGWQQSVVAAIAALFPSFSATGGNSGGAATWGAIVSAYMTLGIAKVPAPYVLVTRSKDWGNVAQDAFSLGGFVANDPETAAFKAPVNPGFQGRFMGGNLWVYTTDETSASGGDNISGMFGAGAIRWTAHMPTPSPATRPLLWTPAFGLEIERDSLKSEDKVVSSTHLGTGIGLNAAGIQLPFLT